MDRDAGDRPRLIALDPQRVTLQDGTPAVALRDLLGVQAEPLVVGVEAYRVMAHFNGRRSLAQVERALAASVSAPAAPAGRPATRAQIEELAAELAQAGWLEGQEYEALHAQALARYRGAPVRAPACAGGSYPAEPARLRQTLERCFDSPEGPGPAPDPPQRGWTRVLVAPHIDFRRGGPGYAHAYRALQLRDGADLYVVFGTAHASPARLFTLTRQDYDTPLGRLTTDREVVEALVEELGEEELLADELVHQSEHSCEFQMVWLRHLFPDRPVRVLPVLCSTISHLADPQRAVNRFLTALQRAVAGRRVCWIAAADLAHVGPRYGDPAPPTPTELTWFAQADRRTLRFLEAGDAAGFHADAIRDDTRRRLCGVAPIYAAMRAGETGARVLHYGQWTDGVDSVSFAAAAG
jgi:hypothetical protein